MSLLQRAAAVAVVGMLAGNGARAAAQDPPEDPDATPTPTVTPTPTATPTPVPPVLPPFGGTTIYVITVTTTTTNVDGPITWVAAPITTTESNTTAPPGTTAAPPGTAGPLSLDLNLTGCKNASGTGRKKPFASQAQVRLPRTATLLVRVDGKRIGTVGLDGTGSSASVPLRLQLARDGELTVRRPSRQVLRVQACTPKAATTRKERT